MFILCGAFQTNCVINDNNQTSMEIILRDLPSTHRLHNIEDINNNDEVSD